MSFFYKIVNLEGVLLLPLFFISTFGFNHYLSISLISSSVIFASILYCKSLFIPTCLSIILTATFETNITLFTFIALITFSLIPFFFPYSFTASEALILSNLISLLLTDMIYFDSDTRYLPFSDGDLKIIQLYMFALIIGMLFIGTTSIPLLNKRLNQDDLKRIYSSLLFFTTSILIILFIIAPLLAFKISKNPIFWIIEYSFSSSRINIFKIWFSIISITIPITILSFPKTPESLNLSRKYYHFIALLLFVPGIILDFNLMHLSFSVATSLFIAIEIIRYNSIYPFGTIINKIMSKFINEKDSGHIIVSHFYLILGCAIPIWFNYNGSFVSSFSGVFSVGVADSVASIVGKRIGKTFWGHSCKTVEGSVAFFVAFFASFFGLALVLNIEFVVWKFILVSFLVGIYLLN